MIGPWIYFLVELIGFADGLDVDCEETEESVVTQRFLDFATGRNELLFIKLKNIDGGAGSKRRSIRGFVHVNVFKLDI